MNSTAFPKIGISACLLGEKVRFNGGDKRNPWLIDQLGKHVQFIRTCPEVSMGLPVPRESVRLERRSKTIFLTAPQSGTDYTTLAEQTAQRLLQSLHPENWDGAIFKQGSPSCGIERVKVYDSNGSPTPTGSGIFGGAFTKAFPMIPAIEEGRLTDPDQREHFVIRLFARTRWVSTPVNALALQRFHQHHKMLILSCSPKHYTELGQMIAKGSKKEIQKTHSQYQTLFTEALSIAPTPKKRANTLEHLAGFLKTELPSEDRITLSQAIHRYREGHLPFQSPLTLLHFLIQKHRIQYARDQVFFEPYPKALKVLDF